MKNTSFFLLILIIGACVPKPSITPIDTGNYIAPNTTITPIINNPSFTITETTQSDINSNATISNTPIITQGINSGNYYYVNNYTALSYPSQDDLKNIQSIWDISNISDLDLRIPQTKEYKANLYKQTPLLIPWTWCSKPGLLEENLAHIFIELYSKKIPKELILSYRTNIGSNECQNWVVKLPWIVEDLVFSIKYVIDEAIFDGYYTYPKGEYEITYFGNVKYDKLLLSEKYKYSLSLLNHYSIDMYHPDSITQLFWAIYQRRIGNGGDVVIGITSEIEHNINICHPIIVEELAKDYPNIKLITEEKIYGDNKFVKIYTPNILDQYDDRQMVEFMIQKNNDCIHIAFYLDAYYLDRGDAITPNLISLMEPEITNIMSTFKWRE